MRLSAFIILFSLCFTPMMAQLRITKDTKVVVTVNQLTKTVLEIDLYSNFKHTSKNPNVNYFMGSLSGSYHLDGTKLLPEPETIIVIYSEKQILSENASISTVFSPLDIIQPGDTFTIGKIVSRVLGVSKGELILKTEKIY